MKQTGFDTFHCWSRLPEELKVKILSYHYSTATRVTPCKIHYDFVKPMMAVGNVELARLSAEACACCPIRQKLPY
jgi:hypothetical protein